MFQEFIPYLEWFCCYVMSFCDLGDLTMYSTYSTLYMRRQVSVNMT